LVFCSDTAPRTHHGETKAAEERRTPKRAGFTLLEMILALAVGLVLMGALYTMLGSQLTQAQVGRDAVEEATLVRSILARLASDVGGSLGPYDPKQVPTGGGSSSSTSSSSSSSNSNSASPSSSADAASAENTMQTTSGPIVFNHGIVYYGNQLVLSVSRAPREVLGADARRQEDGTLPKVSDLRRVIYWIEEGKGLAVQEVKRVTANDIDVTASSDEPIKYIPEVKSMTLQFWDGSSWVQEWDSDLPGADGETPVGPPAAIEIVLVLKHRGKQGDDAEPAELREFRHVISVPTGNNYSSPMTP
jgi:prepilin-type N-terminal cleavage/methylation domain-containing protein